MTNEKEKQQTGDGLRWADRHIGEGSMSCDIIKSFEFFPEIRSHKAV